MPVATLTTKVGSTADARAGTGETIVLHEPDVGATLRTKGRLYLLCEVSPPGPAVAIAREVAELARQEYYYDLSAGIEVSLRRALRQANRRAAQRLRDRRGVTLHAACVVVVNNEVYGARIGAAQVFLVRRARLFLPGDEPGELADFVHRTTSRESGSLGSDPDVLPKVWRQRVESGDALILASGALVDGLGAEALKNAAVTLHPRAAAEHVHNRAVADGIAGSDGAIFVELTAGAAAGRVRPEPLPAVEPEEVLIAERVRGRVDAVWRRRPRAGALLRALTEPLGRMGARGVAVGIELLPRRGAALPRHPDTARERSRRHRRSVTALALLLLVATIGVGAVAYRDYEATRAERDYQLAVLSASDLITSARNLLARTPPDPSTARTRLIEARGKLDGAERSPYADHERIRALRVDISSLIDRIDRVAFDTSKLDAASRPTGITGNANGLYVADPGAGRLWRIWGDPLQTGTVMRTGGAVGRPTTVIASGTTLYTIDDAGKLWLASGNEVAQVTPSGASAWGRDPLLAAFGTNVYVLATSTGMLFKYESADGRTFGPGTPYLPEPLGAATAASLAVNGDVWIVTRGGDILRFRRDPLGTTVTRVDFTPRWATGGVHPSAIQALETQQSVYVLDAGARLVVELAPDGRELARFALSSALPPPTSFYVSEASGLAYTLHGTKLVATSIRR